MNSGYLWLYVSDDKFELPLAVADTAMELATMLDVSAPTVRNSVYRNESGENKKSRYKRVKI